jgi:hypothetical protein
MYNIIIFKGCQGFYFNHLIFSSLRDQLMMFWMDFSIVFGGDHPKDFIFSPDIAYLRSCPGLLL